MKCFICAIRRFSSETKNKSANVKHDKKHLNLKGWLRVVTRAIVVTTVTIVTT